FEQFVGAMPNIQPVDSGIEQAAMNQDATRGLDIGPGGLPDLTGHGTWDLNIPPTWKPDDPYGNLGTWDPNIPPCLPTWEPADPFMRWTPYCETCEPWEQPEGEGWTQEDWDKAKDPFNILGEEAGD